jgi:hypothetical protein
MVEQFQLLPETGSDFVIAGQYSTILSATTAGLKWIFYVTVLDIQTIIILVYSNDQQSR